MFHMNYIHIEGSDQFHTSNFQLCLVVLNFTYIFVRYPCADPRVDPSVTRGSIRVHFRPAPMFIDNTPIDKWL